MLILFRCRYCFSECRANPVRDPESVSCKSCGKPQSLRYTESHRKRNMVDQCVVCAQKDFYIRDDTRKALGLVFLAAGVGGAYFTYAASLLAGGAGFYWYSLRYPKLTICYHCYAKYRNCELNPQHKEYDLEFVDGVEKGIRDDRKLKDFQ
jgi:hypothetical protein